MKSYKKLVVFALLAAGLLLNTKAYAQSDAIKSARQEVIDSLDKFTDAKDESLSPAEKEKKELGLKKSALQKILTLSILETENIKEKLSGLKDIEAEFLVFKEQLIENLESALERFRETEDGLSKNQELTEVENIASALSDWRNASYSPGVKMAVDFIMVFQNKAVLKTADQRFAKISAELRKMRSGKQIWQPVLNQAAQNLREARDAQDQAMGLLAEYLPKTEEDTALPQTDTPELQPPTIRAVITNSLGKTKEAYKHFLNLNEIIKASPTQK